VEEQVRLRLYRPRDEQAVVGLSLRAWGPVFEAAEQVVGRELFARIRGDWRAGQADDVRETLADPAQRVWVAQLSDKTVVGFVAVRLARDSGVGEIGMVAVDPSAQGRGIGTALTERATDWLKASGMTIAMIETGGDPGHATARHLYERAGYTALPAVHYFKAL
jgi:GNAT superfamily N-acetyltransferase